MNNTEKRHKALVELVHKLIRASLMDIKDSYAGAVESEAEGNENKKWFHRGEIGVLEMQLEHLSQEMKKNPNLNFIVEDQPDLKRALDESHKNFIKKTEDNLALIRGNVEGIAAELGITEEEIKERVERVLKLLKEIK